MNDMNFELQRFVDGVDKDKYNRENPPTEGLEEYKIVAIKSVASLMEFFTKIEQGLARTIVTGTGLNVPGQPEIWKPIVRSVGKNFTTEQQITMVEDLIACNALTQVEPLNSTLPQGFRSTDIPYFKACRLAMNYRNELAHSWFIIYVSEKDGQYIHTPILGADNPRAKNDSDDFMAVNIASPEFTNWIFNIANHLPFYMGTPVVEPTDTPADATTFFSKHRDSILSKFDEAKAGKEKGINKFIDSLNTEDGTA